jgi:drug/metabolite transporter (DMT)-like permease
VLGALGHGLPVIGYQLGAPVLGASRSAIIGSLELPIAVTGSLIFLSEEVTLLQSAGIVLIVAGVIWSQIVSAE